jgi:plasmid stability protein
MASITIRNLDESVKRRLKVRAAENGRSMEEEARQILSEGVLVNKKEPNLLEAIRAIVEPAGGIELPEYPRSKRPNMRPRVTFE